MGATSAIKSFVKQKSRKLPEVPLLEKSYKQMGKCSKSVKLLDMLAEASLEEPDKLVPNSVCSGCEKNWNSVQDKWSFSSVIRALCPCAVPDTTTIAQFQISNNSNLCLQRCILVRLQNSCGAAGLQENKACSDTTHSTAKALLAAATGGSRAQQFHHCNKNRGAPRPMRTQVCPQPRPPEELLPAQRSRLRVLLQAVLFLLTDRLKGDLLPLSGMCNFSFV